jgi:hypothetical protein
VTYHTGVRTVKLVVREAKLSHEATGWTQLMSGPFVDFVDPRQNVSRFPYVS